MLIPTLRGMERNGPVECKVYPAVPPKVEYRPSVLGRSSAPLLILISDWSKANPSKVHAARSAFERQAEVVG